MTSSPIAKFIGIRFKHLYELRDRSGHGQAYDYSVIKISKFASGTCRIIWRTCKSSHQCISARGVQQAGVTTVTSRFLGVFADNQALSARFMMVTQGGVNK